MDQAYKSIFHLSAELQCNYDVAGLPTQQSHQKPRGASRNRSEGSAFLTTDGGADCRRDACGCRYQKSFSFPRSAFPAAPEHDPCVHIHLLKEISHFDKHTAFRAIRPDWTAQPSVKATSASRNLAHSRTTGSYTAMSRSNVLH